MSQQHIDYDKLVQNALRGVAREILDRVSREGLPGDHHFYIAFRTRAPGVVLPKHLRQRYPDEMTIVLQHKFWGLKVHADRFEVGLSFNQRPEHLVIPYDAIVGFVDPSVQFALQFEDHEAAGDQEEGENLPPVGESDRPSHVQSAAKSDADGDSDTSEGQAAASAGAASNEDNVVALDAFRKKR